MGGRRALVVGAGISGLTSAIGLRAAGWDVEVEDRGSVVDSRGAALGLWPHAWRGLERLGVTHFLDDAFDYTHASIRSPSGRRMGHLPLGAIQKRNGDPVRLVTRPALMQALMVVLAQDGTRIRFDTTFSAGRDVSGYDLVVGADGINSRVRERVVPDFEPRALGATAWRGSCEGLIGGWGEVWGRGVFAGVTPAGHTRTNWYVAVSDRLKADSFAGLCDLLRGWPKEVTTALSLTTEGAVLRHPLYDLPPLPSYVSDRYVLVGDAAHAMAPSLGQGACQAIVDALALAQSAATHGDVGKALRSYDATQRLSGQRLVKRSRLLLRVQLAARLTDVRDTALRVSRPLAPR